MLRLGAVIIVRLPVHRPTGHEQEGHRPAVVVGLPDRLGAPRFPVLVAVPVTPYRRQPWVESAPELYPMLQAGSGGLPQASVALLDQIRSLDSTRVLRWLGRLTDVESMPIREALRHMLSL